MFFFRKRRQTEGAAATYVPDGRGLRLEKRTKKVFLGWAIFLFFILLGVAVLLVKAPFFYLTKVDVSGNKLVPDDAILALALSRINTPGLLASVLGVNHVFNWPEVFPAEKLRLLPTLKSVLIEKNYGNQSALIHVEEREPYGIWCSLRAQNDADGTQTDAEGVQRDSGLSQRQSAVAAGDRCWWFDNEGVILKKALRAEGSLIPSISDHSQNNLGLGANILPEKLLPNVLSVLETVKAAGLRVKEIILENLERQEITIRTYNGPELYFSLRFSAESTLAAIPNLMSKSGFKDLEYLDFRVENRVYYR